ncbi:MAG: hypothetical protein WCL39_13885, partial [Armatimonadota bacterium]
VKATMHDLLVFLQQSGFDPVVIHLSHFGTSNPEDEGFISIVHALDRIATIYRDEMKENVSPGWCARPNAGPITPSPGLYTRPYWHTRAVDIDLTETPIGVEHFQTFVLSHPLANKDDARESKTVEGYICSFHDALCEQVGNMLPKSQLKDFIALPFHRLRIDDENSGIKHGPQGGALFALGSFNTDDWQDWDRILWTLRTEVAEYAIGSALARKLTQARQTEVEYKQSLLRRGAIHEALAFAATTESIVCDLTRALSKYDSGLADTKQRTANGIVKVHRRIIEVIVKGDSPTNNPVDLSAAFGAARALLWHQYAWNKQRLLEHDQDADATLKYLSEDIGQYEDIDTLGNYITGTQGRVIVSLVNLLDNAIKGNGDIWKDQCKENLPDPSCPRPRKFEVRHCATVSSLSISNSAVLDDQSYTDSWGRMPLTDDPIGFYAPPYNAVYGSGAGSRTDTDFSIRGGRLAQMLLEMYGFCIWFAKRCNDEGRHIGTDTKVGLPACRLAHFQNNAGK